MQPTPLERAARRLEIFTWTLAALTVAAVPFVVYFATPAPDLRARLAAALPGEVVTVAASDTVTLADADAPLYVPPGVTLAGGGAGYPTGGAVLRDARRWPEGSLRAAVVLGAGATLRGWRLYGPGDGVGDQDWSARGVALAVRADSAATVEACYFEAWDKWAVWLRAGGTVRRGGITYTRRAGYGYGVWTYSTAGAATRTSELAELWVDAVRVGVDGGGHPGRVAARAIFGTGRVGWALLQRHARSASPGQLWGGSGGTYQACGALAAPLLRLPLPDTGALVLTELGWPVPAGGRTSPGQVGPWRLDSLPGDTAGVRATAPWPPDWPARELPTALLTVPPRTAAGAEVAVEAEAAPRPGGPGVAALRLRRGEGDRGTWTAGDAGPRRMAPFRPGVYTVGLLALDSAHRPSREARATLEVAGPPAEPLTVWLRCGAADSTLPVRVRARVNGALVLDLRADQLGDWTRCALPLLAGGGEVELGMEVVDTLRTAPGVQLWLDQLRVPGGVVETFEGTLDRRLTVRSWAPPGCRVGIGWGLTASDAAGGEGAWQFRIPAGGRPCPGSGAVLRVRY